MSLSPEQQSIQRQRQQLQSNKALLDAAGMGRTDSVVTALLNGANVNYVGIGGATALHIAVNRGNVSMVEVLLRQPGINLDIQDNDPNRFTPLHLAAKEGDQNMMNILIRQGADQTITDAYGRTAQQLFDITMDDDDDIAPAPSSHAGNYRRPPPPPPPSSHTGNLGNPGQGSNQIR